MQDPKILITGATGNIGTELTKILIARRTPFRAMIRNAKDAEKFAGIDTVETVIADFDNLSTIRAALENIERAFLLTPSTENAEVQQKTFVQTAKEAGIKQIVKLSQWAASADSPVRFLRYHAAVEEEIKMSGLNYTFLRPNLFMQNLLGFKDLIAGEGKFYAPAGDCSISIVDVRDIAEVAAAALTENQHANKIYDITGPESLTHDELASKLSAALGKKIHFVDTPPIVMREMLIKFGMPEWQADGLEEDFDHYRRGEAMVIADGVKQATGKKPFSFDDFARDYHGVFLDIYNSFRDTPQDLKDETTQD